MHERTDVNFLVVAARSRPEHYNVPYVFYTDDRVRQYAEASLSSKSLNTFAMEMEGFLISGMQCKQYYVGCLYFLIDAYPSSHHQSS